MNFLRRIYQALDDRTGISQIVGPIARHLVPPGSKWWYVFGSATLFAFVLQVVTGIILSMSYVPSTNEAYASLQFISHDAVFGHVIRGIHYFGASAMILFVGVHAIRVFLMASYKFPRELNWLTGALLLPLVLGMGFTGQLLRWDQTAVWSVIVGAEQAGRVPFIGRYIAHFILSGDTVGGATLSRFFAIHVFFIPAIIFGLLGLHLYLVLRHGISEPPKAGQPVDPATYRSWYEKMLKREGRPFWPDAAWRDTVFAFCMISVIVLLAWFVGAPELSRPPDPSILQAYPKPDWYFLWYFAALALIPAKLESWVIVLGPIAIGVLFIIVPFISNKGERSPLRRPWAMAFVLMVVVMMGTLWHAGINSNWSPDFSAKPLSAAVVGTGNTLVTKGAALFHEKGCEYCHSVEGQGGHRGPDLTDVADRMTPGDLTIRILSGRGNMPAFASMLKPDEVDAIVAFLKTRSRHSTVTTTDLKQQPTVPPLASGAGLASETPVSLQVQAPTRRSSHVR